MSLFAIRDGLERIQLSDHATVGDLQKQINANLGIPVEDITLSRDKDLVRLKTTARSIQKILRKELRLSSSPSRLCSCPSSGSHPLAHQQA